MKVGMTSIICLLSLLLLLTGQQTTEAVPQHPLHPHYYGPESRILLNNIQPTTSSSSTTSLCGSTTNPIGVCTSPTNCSPKNGGNVQTGAAGCTNPAQSTCCQYTAVCSSQATQGASVFYWQSAGYPAEATGPGVCELTVAPMADTCFLQVQFMDTVLSAPIQETCEGNFLSIQGQDQGSSDVICSTLTNYETLVKPATQTVNGVEVPQSVKFILSITDTSYKYKIKISQVKCSQIEGIIPSTRSLSARQMNEIQQRARSRGSKVQTLNVEDDTKIEDNEGDELEEEEEEEFLDTTDLKHRDFGYYDMDDDSLDDFEEPEAMIKLDEFLRQANDSGALSDDQDMRTEDFKDLCRAAEMESLLRVAPGDDEVDTDVNPYLCYVMIRSETGQFTFCSGTLVDEKYVLTAASCVLRAGFESDQYEVRVFIVDNPTERSFQNRWDEDNERFEVDTVRFHPMAQYNDFSYNIAVLKLKTPVPENTATPISIAPESETFSGGIRALGYGARGREDFYRARALSRRARSIRSNLITNTACQTRLDADLTAAGVITDELFCFRRGRRQTCIGDTGGPIVRGYGPNTPPRLLGIIAGNRFNCIRDRRMPSVGLGTYPDVGIRMTDPKVREFINAATTELEFPISEPTTTSPTNTLSNLNLLSPFSFLFPLKFMNG